MVIVDISTCNKSNCIMLKETTFLGFSKKIYIIIIQRKKHYNCVPLLDGQRIKILKYVGKFERNFEHSPLL